MRTIHLVNSRPVKWFTACTISPGCTPLTKTTKRTIAPIVDLLLFPEKKCTGIIYGFEYTTVLSFSPPLLCTHPRSPWIHNTTFHSLMRVWRLRTAFLGGDISRAPVHTCVRFTNPQPNVLGFRTHVIFQTEEWDKPEPQGQSNHSIRHLRARRSRESESSCHSDPGKIYSS